MITQEKLEKVFLTNNFMNKITDRKTHVYIHTNQTLTQDLDRVLIDNKDAQSHFYSDDPNISNKEQAEYLIGEALLYHCSEIVKWLKTAKNKDKTSFDTEFDYEDYGSVGTGIIHNHTNHTIKEYKTQHVNIVLRKDYRMPLGFALVTSYPDTKQPDIQPTGRDLTQYIKGTKAYQEADDVGKTYLHYRTNVNNNHLVTYSHSNNPLDSMMMLHVQTNNPNTYHEIKIKETSMTLRTITTECDDKGHKIKKPIDTKYTQMYQKATNHTPTHKVNLCNDKVFTAFQQDYPKIAESLKSIKTHIENKQNTTSFNFNKTMPKSNKPNKSKNTTHYKRTNTTFDDISQKSKPDDTYSL